jgi:hypothetical protein
MEQNFRIIIKQPQDDGGIKTIVNSQTTQLNLAIMQARNLIRQGIPHSQVDIISYNHEPERWFKIFGKEHQDKHGGRVVG